MKLAIGDIHGREEWKQYIDDDFTDFYFVGDYFDSFDISTLDQILNFKLICNWARSDPRVHLCIGNHDYQYLKGVHETYSGFQKLMQFDIREVLEANIDIIQPVYLDGDTLISHAGITKTYMSQNMLLHPLDINRSFKQDRSVLRFDGWDSYGDDYTQGCLWVRPNSLLLDKIDGYKQIVGHTYQYRINTTDGITFIDVDNRSIYRF